MAGCGVWFEWLVWKMLQFLVRLVGGSLVLSSEKPRTLAVVMVISLGFFPSKCHCPWNFRITHRSKEDFSWNGFWMGYVYCICFFLCFACASHSILFNSTWSLFLQSVWVVLSDKQIRKNMTILHIKLRRDEQLVGGWVLASIWIDFQNMAHLGLALFP